MYVIYIEVVSANYVYLSKWHKPHPSTYVPMHPSAHPHDAVPCFYLCGSVQLPRHYFSTPARRHGQRSGLMYSWQGRGHIPLFRASGVGSGVLHTDTNYAYSVTAPSACILVLFRLRGCRPISWQHSGPGKGGRRSCPLVCVCAYLRRTQDWAGRQKTG